MHEWAAAVSEPRGSRAVGGGMGSEWSDAAGVLPAPGDRHGPEYAAEDVAHCLLFVSSLTPLFIRGVTDGALLLSAGGVFTMKSLV